MPEARGGEIQSSLARSCGIGTRESRTQPNQALQPTAYSLRLAALPLPAAAERWRSATDQEKVLFTHVTMARQEVMTMMKVAILPIPTAQGALVYRAIAGEKHAQGKTAGEALDALTAQLPADEASTLIIVQNLHPDRFFTAAQQQRLDALMARWRTARDQGATLPVDEQTELEALIDAELQASAARAATLADALGR